MSRVFSNIISNAVKYSDGDLTVRMEPEGRITFANSAKGLDAVAAGRLFDRFYTCLLYTSVADVHLQGGFCAVRRVLADPVQDDRLCHGLARILHQNLQNGELRPGQPDAPASRRDAVGCGVQPQVFKGQGQRRSC